MKLKTFSPTARKLPILQSLAAMVQVGDAKSVCIAIDRFISNPLFQSPGWQSAFRSLRKTVEDYQPRFSIFALHGNSKLPFVAFSTLPGVTCPGAGSCLDFCYSFRSWRYPNAFARQCQNAFLMRFAPAVIEESFYSIARNRTEGFDFRLYVDGDFSSLSDVEFWMSVLKRTPEARAYGYSKSFDILLSYAGQWPVNYQLNVSSGHDSTEATLSAVKTLPIVRGEFRAVSIGKPVKSNEHGTAEVNRAIRAAVDEKVFPCPGSCGSCTGKGHACGMPMLKGRVIAIAMH